MIKTSDIKQNQQQIEKRHKENYFKINRDLWLILFERKIGKQAMEVRDFRGGLP